MLIQEEYNDLCQEYNEWNDIHYFTKWKSKNKNNKKQQ